MLGTQILNNQLDASLIDLAPSAYDMIVATLPPPSHSQIRRNSDALRKADVASSSKAAESAWQRSKNASSSSSTISRGQGKQDHGALGLPNESFVLLQDSVLNTIPPPVHSPTRPKAGSLRTKKSTVRSPPPTPQQSSSDNANPTPLSRHLRSNVRLFNLLSTRTEIDHPLCSECAQILLTNLQRQLDETKKERDGYIAFEKEVRKERDKEGRGLTQEDANKKIEKLKVEEGLAIEQLKEAERERAQLDEELRLLELDEKRLEAEEAECVN